MRLVLNLGFCWTLRVELSGSIVVWLYGYSTVSCIMWVLLTISRLTGLTRLSVSWLTGLTISRLSRLLTILYRDLVRFFHARGSRRSTIGAPITSFYLWRCGCTTILQRQLPLFYTSWSIRVSTG
jgi:hypothetical protein